MVFRKDRNPRHNVRGVARIGKGCSNISGDSFTMMDLPGVKGVALSDGMGCGQAACRESTLVIELLEELWKRDFRKDCNPDDQYNTGLRKRRKSITLRSTLQCLICIQGECEFDQGRRILNFYPKKGSD